MSSDVAFSRSAQPLPLPLPLPLPSASFPDTVADSLRCPACRGELARVGDRLGCRGCAAVYPVARGIPILIDEARSVFRIDPCVASASDTKARTWKEAACDTAHRLVPNVSKNLKGASNFCFMASELRAESPHARLLVIGGGKLGAGLENLLREPSFEVVESDVVIGERTSLVCDAHDLPFADGTFDAVILQGVLEYMADPFRVADEIHRVLRADGMVYAESPFMQPVHGGGHDFFRFTDRGHRRVFHHFEEIKSGVVCGPGMALSSSYRYFLRSLVHSRAGRIVTDAVGRLTSFWLSHLDEGIAENDSSFDAASAFYFLGRRSEKIVSDREIIEHYRGTWKMHA